MSSFLVEFIALIILIVLNGLFALTELSVLSSKKSRLQELSDDGNIGAARALLLLARTDIFLPAVQVGITLVGILSGAFGGAVFGDAVALIIEGLGVSHAVAQPVSFGLVVVAITYASLIIGELVPKHLALAHPERIACVMARPAGMLILFFRPIVYLLEVTTTAILHFFGVKPGAEREISTEEINYIVEQAADQGVLENTERNLVRRALLLDDWKAKSLMTARTEIVWLDIGDPFETNWSKMIESSHTYFPVCEGEFDKLIGLISLKSILKEALRGEQPSIRERTFAPLLVPDSVTALTLLKRLKSTSLSVALLVDEHGSIDGLITLHDILKALAGLSESEDERPVQKVIKRDDGSHLVDPSIHIDELKHLLNIDTLPGEEDGDYDSLRGFILSLLGRIPVEGEKFSCGGYTFEIVDMDRNRIDKVLVTQNTLP